MEYQFFAARDDRGGRIYGVGPTNEAGQERLDQELQDCNAVLTGLRPVSDAIAQLLRALEGGRTITLGQKQVAHLIAVLLGEGAEFGRKQVLELQ